MEYLAAINNLQNVLISVAAAMGGVILTFGGIRFAICFQKLDQHGEHQALYTILAGGMLLGLSGLVALLR